jgi:hypothetical protein
LRPAHAGRRIDVSETKAGCDVPAGANARVGTGEHRRIQTTEIHQSRRIYRAKHYASTR